MKQEYFDRTHSPKWEEYRNALEEYEKNASQAKSVTPDQLVRKYRDVARDLAVARSRNYSNDLVNRLNELTLRGHNVVYVSRSGWFAKFLEFLASGFPRNVRSHKGLFFLSMSLLLGPALIVAALIVDDNQNIHSILSTEQIEQMETMYDPGTRNIGREPDANSNVHAFGFYVYNNASIGLRVFATGIFFGIGTVFVLVFNGVFLSAVITHLLVTGYSSTLLPFISGHSAMELTAIVIAGAAGLRLGQATVAPGSISRTTAILQGGREAVQLACGSFLMFLIAAFIEAFWSPQDVLPIIKYVVGIVMWIVVISYFTFAGRNAVS